MAVHIVDTHKLQPSCALDHHCCSPCYTNEPWTPWHQCIHHIIYFNVMTLPFWIALLVHHNISLVAKVTEFTHHACDDCFSCCCHLLSLYLKSASALAKHVKQMCSFISTALFSWHILQSAIMCGAFSACATRSDLFNGA
jgi:hypothetical protein